MIVEEPIFQINIVVLGDSKVGKTALLMTYCDRRFPHDYIPIMFDGIAVVRTYRGDQYHIVIKECSGMKNYKYLRRSLYIGADFFVICYSVNNPKSLSSAETIWAPEVHRQNPNAPIILVGTKTDLRNKENGQELVKEDEGYDVAKRIQSRFYIETSSLHNENITELFNGVFEMFRPQNRRRCVIF
ncbi:GTPase_rho, putative [Entamoeba dispar SAW760]|uniref:small monomeric GTPase n=1 Tax=Entamoeba dispar (strain ATCC PRA-260 / SAW760) TaxID=370354 RepID=B0E5H2_ENTDS|nr:GTPase_rho, putative [Entamoeba dispar SAW760]EDR30221.1 GTPase_rho, putative [Entamoeba dispar SAW760]|eukprot:EDR30221.1 GTPase_rho, putative [Entamoeba dispar SAW760]